MARIPQKPFNKIALSCSGGGYRATAFHLGTLSYLNRLQFQKSPLIENIKTISTVSGGTITGVVYSLMKQQGKTFDEFYSFLIRQLQNHDLVKESLDKIDNDTEWNNDHKRKNLINAFAELYDEGFTKGATFDVFYNNEKSHIDHVIFNSIEFRNGVNFRFQNKGVLGNNYSRIRKDAAKEIKLSDIIAASSCFPGGFEPISFPNDFVYDQAIELKKYQKEWQLPIGLMDGGIYDNQGIESILLSTSRKSKVNNYDLILISDVSSPYMQNFKFFEEKEPTGYRSLTYNKITESIKRKIRKTKYALFTLFFLGIVLTGLGRFSDNIVTGLGIAIAVIAVILIIIFYYLNGKASNLFQLAKVYVFGKIPLYFQSKFKEWDISNYPLGRIEPLFFDRVSSMGILINEVFLKQIRRLQYAKVYTSNTYKFRRISNLIKELTEVNYTGMSKKYLELEHCPTELKGTYQDVIGPNIKALIEEASAFGTTLWFTPEDEIKDVLDKLIACGQVTTCYNLLVYLTELIHTPKNGFDKLSAENQKEIQALFDYCLKDWKQFKERPIFLINH